MVRTCAESGRGEVAETSTGEETMGEKTGGNTTKEVGGGSGGSC